MINHCSQPPEKCGLERCRMRNQEHALGFVPTVSTPHTGWLERGSDTLGSRRSGLNPGLLQPIANLRLAEASLGRTCML
jgi:hypothetical protein